MSLYYEVCLNTIVLTDIQLLLMLCLKLHNMNITCHQLTPCVLYDRCYKRVEKQDMSKLTRSYLVTDWRGKDTRLIIKGSMSVQVDFVSTICKTVAEGIFYFLTRYLDYLLQRIYRIYLLYNVCVWVVSFNVFICSSIHYPMFESYIVHLTQWFDYSAVVMVAYTCLCLWNRKAYVRHLY